eukprot:283682_1
MDPRTFSWCILVMILIVHLSSSQTISCQGAFECSNQTISYTDGTKLESNGYKSHYLSSITYPSGQIKCFAAFSCAEVSFMSTLQLSCAGDSSCSKVSNISISPSVSYIHITGVNALIHSTISSAGDHNILCYAEQSCAHCHISGFSSIDG